MCPAGRGRISLLSELTIDTDLDLGSNKIKFTDILLKQEDVNTLALKNSADSVYKQFSSSKLMTNTVDSKATGDNWLRAANIEGAYALVMARDNGVGSVEIARLQGAADPYFQLTLPAVMKPGAVPAAVVEGMFGYNNTTKRFWYRDDSQVQTPYQLVVAQTEVFDGAAPTTFTDLDLSGVVGANLAVVILKVTQSSSASSTVAFRQNGDGDNSYPGGDRTMGVGGADIQQSIFANLVVITDSAGKVEWKAQAADTFTIDVVAYLS